MTLSLNNVAVQQFADNFINVYQGTSKLRGTTMVVRGVVGDAYKFKLAGSAVMGDRGAFQSLVPASDITYTAPTVSFSNKILNLPTDIFEQAEVNANERMNLAKVHAMAMGRQEDQFIIDALIAGATKIIVNGATNLTLAKLIEASKRLNDDDVPSVGRHIAVSADALDSLLNDTTLTSTDFNTVRVLQSGEIDSFMGFKFHIIGNRTEGGLPVAASIRKNFAWHEDAIGMAFSMDPKVTVEWSPERQSWLSISTLRAGAIAIDANGIVEVDGDES